MSRTGVVLVVAAVAAALVLSFSGTGGMPDDVLRRLGVRAGMGRDLSLVAVGVAGGLLLAPLTSVRWGAIPQMIASLLHISRRNVGLAGLAAIFAAVLLLY